MWTQVSHVLLLANIQKFAKLRHTCLHYWANMRIYPEKTILLTQTSVFAPCCSRQSKGKFRFARGPGLRGACGSRSCAARLQSPRRHRPVCDHFLQYISKPAQRQKKESPEAAEGQNGAVPGRHHQQRHSHQSQTNQEMDRRRVAGWSLCGKRCLNAHTKT